jgi:cytochrome c-type biogenesis protein CcmE
MSWLPRSPKARRRLWVVAAVAPILALAVGLSLWAMNDSVTFFFTPSEVTVEKAPAGRDIRLGGLVEAGSVQRHGADVSFAVTDNAASTRVIYHGDLPDLFREGQGIVAQGSLPARPHLRRPSGPGQARREIHAARGRRQAQGQGRMAS